MFFLNALLVDTAVNHAWFRSSTNLLKTSALNFFISTSKIHLAVVPLLNSVHPC